MQIDFVQHLTFSIYIKGVKIGPTLKILYNVFLFQIKFCFVFIFRNPDHEPQFQTLFGKCHIFYLHIISLFCRFLKEQVNRSQYERLNFSSLQKSTYFSIDSQTFLLQLFNLFLISVQYVYIVELMFSSICMKYLTLEVKQSINQSKLHLHIFKIYYATFFFKRIK